MSKTGQATDEAAYDQLTARLRKLRDDADPASVGKLLDLCAPKQPDRVRDDAADHLWEKVSMGAARFSAEAPTPLQSVLKGEDARLLALLDDKQATVRLSGIKILAKIETGDSRQRIARLASSDPDQEVRELAGKAVGP